MRHQEFLKAVTLARGPLLAALLAAACPWPAAAGYAEAEAALKGGAALESRALEALLARPGGELARSERATALAADNRAALELFREAASAPTDGYLLAPKMEKPTVNAKAPNYGGLLKLLRLALIDARIKAARGRRAEYEADLLAAAGLIGHLGGQRSFVLLSSLAQQTAVRLSFADLSESVRSGGIPYLAALAARLAAADPGDYLAAGVREEMEMAKNSARAAFTPEEAARARGAFPALERYAALRLQTPEFFDIARERLGAELDAQGEAFAGAFRENDPGAAGKFSLERSALRRQRRETYMGRGRLAALKDLAFGGAEARAALAALMTDAIIEVSVPDYGKLVPRYHASLCSLRVLRAAAAVKLYRLGKRRLPEGLDQLVPEYLPEAPADTFNKPSLLTYKKKGKGFLIYSFGPDRRDDGGARPPEAEEGAEAAGGDIVYSE